jgi:hypothetical protein
MGRQVHSGEGGDDPLSKVVKLFPSEVSAAFLAVNNIVGSDKDWHSMSIWAPALFLLVMCPLLLHYVQKVDNPIQIIVSTVLFPIWVVNIAPLRFGVDETTAAIILTLSTVVLPLVPAPARTEEPQP